jgi:RHS repeat-associated protein
VYTNQYTPGNFTVSPSIVNSTISRCNYGIYIIADGSSYGIATVSPVISGNTISNWNNSGIYVKALDDGYSIAQATVSSNIFQNSVVAANQALTFDGNGWWTNSSNTFTAGNRLCIGLSGSLSESRTWSNIPGVPYYLAYDLTVDAGATLTVSPGTVVLARYNSSAQFRINVEGVLNADGAVFTIEDDPDYGIVSGTPLQDWYGIRFLQTGGGEIRNCTIRYAIRGIECSVYTNQYTPGNFTVSPSIVNSTISRCNYGIYIIADGSSYGIATAETIIFGSTITGCSTGIYVTQANDGYSRATAVISFTTIAGNGTGLNNQTSNLLSAVFCSWGDPSGPNHILNPEGTGDPIYGDVNFASWEGLPPPQQVVYGTNNSSPKSADPVNTATGNFTYEQEDLFIAAVGLNFSFTRYYNSQSSVSGPLGYGWSHSYQMKLTLYGDGSAQVQYADGHEQKFLPDGSGGFLAPPDAFDTLTNNGGGTYSLLTKDQIEYLLEGATGRLLSISDLNDNVINLTYDANGDLDRITDTVGRVIEVTCNANHRIISLTDPIGRLIEYSYNVNGDLEEATDARGHFELYTYDAAHQMLTAVDKRGNTKISLTYDASKVVTSQRDAYSNPTSYVYDTVNRMTTITDAYGKIYRQYYDANFRMIKEVDPKGNFAEYTYDAKGNRTSVKDKLGRVTAFDFDEHGNVIKKTDPLGHITLAKYNSLNLPTRKIDELGFETVLAYDAKGNLLSVTNALGNSIGYTYNSRGQKLSETDARVKTTGFDYDAAGNLQRVTNAMSGQTQYSYDAVSRLISTTDPLLRVTTFGYDPNDNRTAVTNALTQTTSFDYDENDNLRSTTNPLLQTVSYEYDLKNRLVKVTDPLEKKINYSYDKLDRKIAEIDPLGNQTSFTYDELGNLLTVEDALTNTTRYTYDANGRKTSMTDARGNITAYEYDELGRLKKVTDAPGGISMAAYDARGSLIQVTDPMGRVTRYEYDALGKVIKETDPLLINTLYTYDGNGNLSSKRDGNNVVSDYTYDDLNRLTRIAYTGGDVTQYNYDAAGNRLSMSDTVGTTSYTYDALNRPLSVQDAYGKTVGYRYDEAGRRTKIIYPGNKEVIYGYDAAGRLVTVTDWLNNQTDFDYDLAGRLVNQVNANGTTVDRQYDIAGRLVNLQNKKSGGAVISSHSFTLDPMGNRTGVTETLPLTPTFGNQSLTFNHNAGHQLISDDLHDYAYDLNGNRNSSDDGATLTSYEYNHMDRLAEVNDGVRVDSYRYNGDGALVAAVRNGNETRYVLDTAAGMPNMLAETDAAGIVQRYNIHGNGLLYAIEASDEATKNYHYDAIGNTLALTDDTENVTDKYAYGPYGEAAGSSGVTTNRFCYIGQSGVMNEDNGLMFMRARFYEQKTKRFLSNDPVKGNISDSKTLNPYTYCVNNPVIYADPEGKEPITLTLIAAVAATVAFNEYVVKPYILPAVVEMAQSLPGSYHRRNELDPKSYDKEKTETVFDVGMFAAQGVIGAARNQIASHTGKAIQQYSAAQSATGKAIGGHMRWAHYHAGVVGQWMVTQIEKLAIKTAIKRAIDKVEDSTEEVGTSLKTNLGFQIKREMESLPPSFLFQRGKI